MPDSPEQNLGQQAFTQFMEIWVVPEIKRRQSEGTLPTPVDLEKFQIIWFPYPREREIRINNEVRGKLQIKLRDGIQKKEGDDVYPNDIEAIEMIKMSDLEDADCGHATFLRFRDQWFGQFDAVYNKGIASTYLKRGDEFLTVAKHGLAVNMMSAFIDTLFSAAELFAKGKLLLLAEFQFRDKTGHKNAANRFNYHAHLGNVPAEQRDAFNRLSQWRYPARYVDQGDVPITRTAADDLVRAVESMREDIQKMIG